MASHDWMKASYLSGSPVTPTTQVFPAGYASGTYYSNQARFGPRALRQIAWAVSDRELADPSFVAYTAERVTLEVQKHLEGMVVVSEYRNTSFSSTTISVEETNDVARGVPVTFTATIKDWIVDLLVPSPRIAQALKDISASFKAGSLGFSTTAATATTASLTMGDLKAAYQQMRAATPMVSPAVGSFTGSFTASGNVTSGVSSPEPPPAPEPMWSPTPVYGFRSWEVSNGHDKWGQFDPPTYTDEVILPGILMGKVTPWETARCEAACYETHLSRDAITAGHAPEDHDAPHWGCHCGVYVTDDPNHQSVKAIDRLIPQYYNLFMYGTYAVGIVELTGTIIQHETGSRGQTGEIKHLWVAASAASIVMDRYPDVPITAVNEPKDDSWANQAGIDADAKSRAILHADLYTKLEELREPWLK